MKHHMPKWKDLCIYSEKLANRRFTEDAAVKHGDKYTKFANKQRQRNVRVGTQKSE